MSTALFCSLFFSRPGCRPSRRWAELQRFSRVYSGGGQPCTCAVKSCWFAREADKTNFGNLPFTPANYNTGRAQQGSNSSVFLKNQKSVLINNDTPLASVFNLINKQSEQKARWCPPLGRITRLPPSTTGTPSLRPNCHTSKSALSLPIGLAREYLDSTT